MCQPGEDIALAEDTFGAQRGEDFLQLRIVIGAEKSEWRNKSARADAGYHLKLRSCSCRRPAVEKACPERAVIRSPRQGEKASRGKLQGGVHSVNPQLAVDGAVVFG